MKKLQKKQIKAIDLNKIKGGKRIGDFQKPDKVIMIVSDDRI